MPNIESSWHNLCQSRAQSGLTNAIGFLEKEFGGLTLPMNNIELDQFVMETESVALKDLKKELVGDQKLIDEIINQFKQVFNEKSA